MARTWGWLVAVVLMFAVARPARADIRLGAGVHAWLDDSAMFTLTLAGSMPIVRHLDIGARGGVLATVGPGRLGVPIDLQLRLHGGRLYGEGNVGPWILFEDSPLHIHASFGFGLQVQMIAVGIEVGYLNPHAMIGLQVALRF